MSDVVVRVENLSKQYHIKGLQARYKTFRGALTDVWCAPFRRAAKLLRGSAYGAAEMDETIWALKNVSLEVKRGEVLGIIGRNGAGKSTLLKILSRITEPTEGRAEIRGRVGSLLEVGTGFHPELTGRENIYLNGAILGMKKEEIDHKFDEIVAFAEIEKFIDTPIKFYSSGMYVRLAFSVAAHLEPDILIVDEVLAVGDAMFREKCFGKMHKVATEGRTVLFVSHLMKAVEMLCDRVILLNEGRIVCEGEPLEIVRYYLGGEKGDERSTQDKADFQFPSQPDKPAQIKRLRIFNSNGELSKRHDILEPIKVVVDFELRINYPTLVMYCFIKRAGGFSESYGEGTFLTSNYDWINYNREKENLISVFPMKVGTYTASFIIPQPFLNTGIYEIEFFLTTGPQRQDTQRDILFEIEDKGSFVSTVQAAQRSGFLAYPLKWDLEQTN